ncbi:hypothetical protein D3C80_2002680 [compost metagenome]
MFFLNEAAVDHFGLGQLIAQLLQVEGLRQRGKAEQHQQAQMGDELHGSILSTASISTFGEASCISRLAMCTATCTELARVRRSPLAKSLIR